MYKQSKKLFINSLLFTLLFIFFTSHPAFSQSTPRLLNIGNYFKINDSNLKEGYIVSITPNGVKKTTKPYDSSILGVIADKAGISFEPKEAKEKGYYPVIFSGTTYVYVSTINGDIKKGDFITSSNIPGVGMKATQDGITIGMALTSYNSDNPKQEKLIPIAINIKYATLQQPFSYRLRNIFNVSKNALYEEPITGFKYLFAALALVLSFGLTFLHFGKVTAKGIEALGRNPLASKSIYIGIFLNIAIGIAILLAGVFLGLFVLSL